MTIFGYLVAFALAPVILIWIIAFIIQVIKDPDGTKYR